MKQWLILILFTICSIPAFAQSALKTKYVVLITLDGMRWQEVFTGADPKLITNKTYVDDTTGLKELFWRSTPEERKKVLMPFFWETINAQGQLYGNRMEGSLVNVTNSHWFSYPGYNEILAGFADDNIDSNDKIPNPNKTVLEFINQQPGFKGKAAAFGSWDVFPFIINEERSGIPVNAGYEIATGTSLTPMEKALNTLQPVIPGHWSTVRMDAFTHYYALEYLKKEEPSLLYISYGETDDFAHDGNYEAYLKSAYRTDQFIKDLWNWVQANKKYKNKTTFVITTDHGRGTEPLDEWRGHGAKIQGADEIWMAVMGPDTPAMSPVKGQFYQNQVAATVAALLGVEYQSDQKAGAVLDNALGKK